MSAQKKLTIIADPQSFPEGTNGNVLLVVQRSGGLEQLDYTYEWTVTDPDGNFLAVDAPSSTPQGSATIAINNSTFALADFAITS